MKTVLITGGAGNLACQMTHTLAAHYDRMVLFDIVDEPKAVCAEGCVSVKGDITDAEGLDRAIETHRPDTIIHLASLLSGSSETDRGLAWRINVDGTFHILEAALRHGVEKVFFSSSVATYGGELPDPLPEAQPQWPDSLYGVSKVACERLGHYYHAKHGLDFRCLRLPIVVSCFAVAGAVSAYASNAFIASVREGGYIFKVRPETRSALVYVEDAIKAMVQLLTVPRDQLSQCVYNIDGLTPSGEELAAAARQAVPGAQLGFEPEDDVVHLIESWPRRIDDAAARRDWDWQPSYDLLKIAQHIVAELRRSE